MVNTMADDFVKPDFTDGLVEIRIDDDSIAIYGTREGLMEIARMCNELAKQPPNQYKTDHVHLEDRNILTRSSKNVAIAYFD